MNFLFKTTLLAIILGAFVYIPQSALAQGFSLSDARSTATQAGLSGEEDASNIIVNFLKWAAGILAFVFMAAIVVAGALFIFSAGERTADIARQIVFYSIIGLVVALLAWVILNTVAKNIVGSGAGTPVGGSGGTPPPITIPAPSTTTPSPGGPGQTGQPSPTPPSSGGQNQEGGSQNQPNPGNGSGDSGGQNSGGERGGQPGQNAPGGQGGNETNSSENPLSRPTDQQDIVPGTNGPSGR